MNTQHSTGSALGGYLRVLRRGALVVIGTAIVVTGIAVASSLSQEKLYEASADVFLSGARNLPSNLAELQVYNLDPERAGNTQANLARVPEVARTALRKAKVRGRTPKDLLGSSTVTTKPKADILTFTVTDPDRDLANRLATAYANAFTGYRREIDTSSIVDARRQIEQRLRALEASRNTRGRLYEDLATKDQQLRTAEALQGSNAALVRAGQGAEQVQPKPVRNAMLGLILGIVMGVALAFLRNGRGMRSSRFGSSGFLPYTDDEDADTTRRTPASLAASSTLSVPITLVALLVSGSWTDRGTDGRAAWWKTTSQPRTALWTRS